MAKYLAWVGTTTIALAGIVVGVLPIDVGPRWAWLSVGIFLGACAGFTFLPVWRPGNKAAPSVQPKKVVQKPTMNAGNNATQINNEGGGTFNINKDNDKES